jgi:DUF1680 family protein
MLARVLLVFPVCLSAAVPRPLVPDKVADQFTPAALDSQKIDGLLGQRMLVNLDGRLLHLDQKAVLEGFQHRPGKQEWIGEHAGKFLHAAALTWSYTHDERLKTLMDAVAKQLMAAQEADGYLGTYSDDRRWTGLDVWTHKYDLIGLLAYYSVTGDTAALATCRRIGDLLVKTFGDKPGRRDIIRSGEHVGMAATSVLEPMVMLYRYTGTRAYLDFCYYLTRAWEQPDGPHIISSLMTTGSVYKTANGKAYEMLSNLVGLSDLYRITGEVRFLTPAELAWLDISDRRLYISGTTSSSEHFRDNDQLPADEKAEVGEGCVTVTWMQLNLQLLRITGEAKYADQLERSIYNQLLAAQNPRNGDFCYFTPLNGRKNASPGISCCVSSEPRGMAMIPQAVWGERAGGIAVNLYVPGHMTTKLAEIQSETAFPLDGHVSLTVNPAGLKEFPIFLHVPEWTRRYIAKVDGKQYAGHPGEYLPISRRWSKGDRIEIEMEMTVQVISGAPTYPDSVAIQRGPQVLALETDLNKNPAPPQIASLHLRDAPAGTFREALTREAFSREAFIVDAKSGSPLILIPFADAKDYRVWMPKP